MPQHPGKFAESPRGLSGLLSFFGREQELPPVDTLNEEDLERMQFQARQQGDQGRVQRIDDIRALRRGFAVDQRQQANIQGQLLSDPRAQGPAQAPESILGIQNPFGAGQGGVGRAFEDVPR